MTIMSGKEAEGWLTHRELWIGLKEHGVPNGKRNQGQVIKKLGNLPVFRSEAFLRARIYSFPKGLTAIYSSKCTLG